jgi:hypothetical protein
MHRYVHGHWAASTYDIKGRRSDHLLFLSIDGTFRWTREWADDDATQREEDAGNWARREADDTLRMVSVSATHDPVPLTWSIRYVTGCEDSNMILVLQVVALISPNLPIMFTRVHPADDPVWRA